MKKERLPFLVIICSIFLLLSTYNVFADTNVSGVINTDTTWTLAGSPYIVTGNVLLNSGVKLTIQPGVTVKLNSGKSLQIDGTLIAKGTTLNKITFTSNQPTPAPGDWGYILFSDSSTDATYDENGNYTNGSILEYSIVEYAGGASISDNGALRMYNAHPFINYTIIRNNAASGIYGWDISQTVKITNSSISNNASVLDGGGIYLSSYSNESSAVISHNTINNNSAAQNGGGILIALANISISDNDIMNNNASLDAGGVWAASSIAGSLINNKISKNTAFRYGGGINISGIIFTVSNNMIEHNSAGTGGGIYTDVWSNGITISKNIITYNSSSGYGGDGGGIASFRWGSFDPVPIIIYNNIISNNSSLASGGGIHALYLRPIGLTANGLYNFVTYSVSESGTYCNSIINNSAANASAIWYSAINDIDNDFTYNLIHNNISSGSSQTHTIYIGSHPLFNFNNIFANTANYEFWNDNAHLTENVDARSNWWGTVNEFDIQKKIYDWFDDSTKGILDYAPWENAIITEYVPVSPPADLTVIKSSGQISLSWSANPEPDVAGYNVYWDTDSGHPYANVVDAGKVTSYIITGLDPAKTWYVGVTAYDEDYNPVNDDPDTIVNETQTNGNESWYSTPIQTYFEEDDPAITYSGTWNTYSCPSCSGGAIKYSNQTGANASFTFSGTGIKWIVTKGPMMGKAKIYLDGVYMGMIDLYSPTIKYQVVLQKTWLSGLALGTHTAVIEVSGKKNTNSKGYFINIDAFEVVP